ncbi:MAG TPA: cation diffusion facilitator family transporter [Acidimicrobiales bacterium]|nr:MAG: cation transporter [Actinobacteria bacterium 21-64-8]HQT99387.1 cation diffusion facilitator family transporter [Acidimicrobiales bacterium]
MRGQTNAPTSAVQADAQRAVVTSHASHHHGAPTGDARALRVALSLLAVFLVVEVVAAFVAHSIALLADAGHLLVDIGALAVSLWAVRLAQRPASVDWTFGLKRAEILAAAMNGVTLVAISGVIGFEAVRRLQHPHHVEGGVVIVVALVGVVTNLFAARVLARSSRTSLNVEGSYRHIVTDLYAFIATLVAGVIIVATHFERADAIASLLVVLLMLRAAYELLRASGTILLEATPSHVNLHDLRAHLLDVDHVQSVHDLHAWTVTSGLPVLTAHVVVDDECFQEGCVPRILDELQACLGGHFDIEHSTFQMEPESHLGHEPGSH